MTLPKIEEYEIRKGLLDHIKGIELRGIDTLRKSLQGEIPSDTAITWPSEFQANIANGALDYLNHDPSERYKAEDFSQILHYIPSDLTQPEGKFLCDLLNDGYKAMLIRKLRQSDRK